MIMILQTQVTLVDLVTNITNAQYFIFQNEKIILEEDQHVFLFHVLLPYFVNQCCMRILSLCLNINYLFKFQFDVVVFQLI